MKSIKSVEYYIVYCVRVKASLEIQTNGTLEKVNQLKESLNDSLWSSAERPEASLRSSSAPNEDAKLPVLCNKISVHSSVNN